MMASLLKNPGFERSAALHQLRSPNIQFFLIEQDILAIELKPLLMSVAHLIAAAITVPQHWFLLNVKRSERVLKTRSTCLQFAVSQDGKYEWHSSAVELLIAVPRGRNCTLKKTAIRSFLDVR